MKKMVRHWRQMLMGLEKEQTMAGWWCIEETERENNHCRRNDSMIIGNNSNTPFHPLSPSDGECERNESGQENPLLLSLLLEWEIY